MKKPINKTMTKLVILTFSFFINYSGFSQKNINKELKDFPYPKGLYKSFNDFKLKTPSKDISFTASQLDTIASTGFQLIDNEGKIIKKAFAISDGEKIFVRVKSMNKYFHRPDKDKRIDDRPKDIKMDYSLAYFTSENYLYFENYFYNKQMMDLIGGMTYLKGIIYLQSSEKFLVFKYNQDFKNYLSLKSKELTDNYSINFKVKSDSLIIYPNEKIIKKLK